MNLITHKLCRKCNTEYKHYGSSLTKCPRCEELKNELKGNGRDVALFSNANASQKFYGKDKGNRIKSERARKKLRKLTSEPSAKGYLDRSVEKKGKYNIAKVSDKKRKAKALIALLKGERIAEIGKKCECCGKPGEVDYSHNIPVSIREDLETVKGAGHLAHRICHNRWEHFQEPKEVLKFKNLDWLLNFLKENDTGRYMHVCDLLKIEYDLNELQPQYSTT